MNKHLQKTNCLYIKYKLLAHSMFKKIAHFFLRESPKERESSRIVGESQGPGFRSLSVSSCREWYSMSEKYKLHVGKLTPCRIFQGVRFEMYHLCGEKFYPRMVLPFYFWIIKQTPTL